MNKERDNKQLRAKFVAFPKQYVNLESNLIPDCIHLYLF